RFMQEDTLSDLVPTASFGHMLGVPVPTIDMIIELESIMLGKDFKAEGRTVEKLGLAGRTPEEIRELVK
ncbi:MAG: NADP transhydrogenase subunit alpha, partial [Clostridiales bacterium]|nr:NADP transhydrogenase subunit alpha [Clostridiales bacterium]